MQMRSETRATRRMSTKPLDVLVQIYLHTFGPRLAEYLNYFQKLNSLNNAIRFACHGKEGKIHGHQHLVGKYGLEQARKSLQQHADEIESSHSFDELLTCVENCTKSAYRFGVLAVYDTSLRLGAYLDLWPEVVYLHAGAKKGCKALGIETIGGTVAMNKLPKALQVLKPYQAEDFLCIFKDQLAGQNRKAKGC